MNKYEGFCISLGEALHEMTLEAVKGKKSSVQTEKAFNTGYLAAFHRIITLIQQQAEIYDIPLDEISLNDIKDTDII